VHAADAKGRRTPQKSSGHIVGHGKDLIIGKPVAGRIRSFPIVPKNIVTQNAFRAAEISILRPNGHRTDIAGHAIAHPITGAEAIVAPITGRRSRQIQPHRKKQRGNRNKNEKAFHNLVLHREATDNMQESENDIRSFKLSESCKKATAKFIGVSICRAFIN
jgi:hypothetical protein